MSKHKARDKAGNETRNSEQQYDIPIYRTDDEESTGFLLRMDTVGLQVLNIEKRRFFRESLRL